MKKKIGCYLIHSTLLFPAIAVAQDTIVVTASGFEQQEKEAPATISVITAQQLESKPYRDITDALRDVPGVNVSGGGGGTDITIRGMDAKYTLILIDGKRVRTRETRPNSDGPGIEQGWLPPLSAIERIEVVRGPMSSLYGSDAMGGVINIITKRIGKTWNNSIRLESIFQEDSKSSNPSTASFSTSGPLIEDRLGFQLYGQYSGRNEDKYLDGFPEQKLRSLNGKLTFQANERHQFDLDAGISLQEKYWTSGKTTSRKSDKHESRRNSESLTHRGTWDWGTSLSTLGYDKTNNTTRQMKAENTDFDTQFLLPFNNHMLSLGGKYSYQQLSDKENMLNKNITKIDRWDYALFMEDEWKLLDNLSLTLGLRFNKDENFGNHWNPRIYSVWSIDDNFTLKGGVTTGYTTPNLRAVVADWGQETGGGRKAVILGNPDLKPEKSTNYEIGVAYSNDYGLNASATAFYTQFKDKIQSYYICSKAPCSINGIETQFPFIQGRQNVDNADIKGLELSASLPLLERLKLSSSYTWLNSKQKSGANEGLPLNRTPKHKANIQLDWATTDRLDLWTKIAYYGKETEMGNKNNKVKKGEQYSSYTLWDLGGVYNITTQTKLYSGIYNILDKTIDYDSYGKTLDGRRYWLGLNVNF